MNVDINIPFEEINDCPETDFHHADKCPILTCQFNNNVTDTGCLARDRHEVSNKTMSDSEMYIYKMPEALNVRQVGTKRKLAIKKVKNLIFLSFFIFYIKDNYTEKDGMPYKKGVSPRVDSLFKNYPLNLSQLKFEPWVLKYLLDEDIYKTYIQKEVQNLNTDINLKNMLDTTPKKLAHLKKEVKKFCSLELINVINIFGD